MTFFRLGLCAAALTLSSCSLSTAPEPSEFKLSAEALSKQYRATRKTGAVRLYANEIQTTRDEWGRETHLASGGSLLVKESVPPILAMAPSISITPDFAEARGKATVKKADRLYVGQDESSTIRIDGTAIKPEGPHVIRGIANEAAAAEAKAKAEAKAAAKMKAEEDAKVREEAKALAKVEKAQAEAEAKAQKEEADRAKAEAKAMAQADAKAKAETEAKEKAEADKMQAEADMRAAAKAKAEVVAQEKAEKTKAAAMAKVADETPPKPKKSPTSSASTAAKKRVTSDSKPMAQTPAPAKPSPAVVQPSSPAAADKPKAVPAADRARLLNLMREPTER